MSGMYLALTLAGALVLGFVFLSDQSPDGVLVLGLWGGLTFPGGLACLLGVLRAHYRWEWIGSWVLAMGTTVYLASTFAQIYGSDGLLSSMPTLLVFASLVCAILARAIQLSLIDLQARGRVLAQRAATGEMPEVAVHE